MTPRGMSRLTLGIALLTAGGIIFGGILLWRLERQVQQVVTALPVRPTPAVVLAPRALMLSGKTLYTQLTTQNLAPTIPPPVVAEHLLAKGTERPVVAEDSTLLQTLPTEQRQMIDQVRKDPISKMPMTQEQLEQVLSNLSPEQREQVQQALRDPATMARARKLAGIDDVH